ncbi:putative TrkA-N domain dehydrogenase [Colletotrichum musicola]|uniref:Putative TrkA-N domain dehydrogenase n=1 Tax=Colletotrichum musicola TaxID=2175873 RepID=A0A8H6N4Y4_9PEZI|nr:putative TrkA-N domain dehydrogenase [Colletotrichum musicola]
MHILLLGATGRNGTHILSHLLSHSHTVTALLRIPSSLPPTPNLTLIPGSPLSLTDIQTAFSTPRAPDAVIIALNPRRLSDSPFAALHPETPEFLMRDSVRNVISAVRSSTSGSSQTTKIVVNSMQGSGPSRSSLNLPVRLMMDHTNMKHTLADHDAVDALLRSEEARGVNWVLVRPPMLTDGDALPVRVFPDDGRGASWMPRITRASLAAFMVDAVERPDWDGQGPVVTN